VEHAKFNRYIRGINEARFNDANKWLNALGLYVENNDIYCIEHINNKIKIPLDQENQLFLNAKIDSIQDNLQ
jgi:bifunctional pyridoxal-dependent enzyme with beta-cystathionase and maltose regulon repressor activities